MKRDIKLWQFVGYVFTVALGTILHFLYDWTGSVIVTPFSAVNESTWEHMKILFFPMAIFTLVQGFFFKKDYENFYSVKLKGITLGTLSMPVIFYTLNGVFGQTSAFVNIAIFFVCAAIAFIYEYFKFSAPPRRHAHNKTAIALIIAIAVLFIIFTYFPPHVPLFRDPVTLSYGLLAVKRV